MISPFLCKNFFIKSVDTPSCTRYSANHLLFNNYEYILHLCNFEANGDYELSAGHALNACV